MSAFARPTCVCTCIFKEWQQTDEQHVQPRMMCVRMTTRGDLCQEEGGVERRVKTTSASY